MVSPNQDPYELSTLKHWRIIHHILVPKYELLHEFLYYIRVHRSWSAHKCKIHSRSVTKYCTRRYKGLHRALRCGVLDGSSELGLTPDLPVLRWEPCRTALPDVTVIASPWSPRRACHTLSAGEPGPTAPPRAWPHHGDCVERERAAPTGMGRLGHCSTGLGQQCWASGWKADPVPCNDFLIFNFRLIFQKICINFENA
jgi:hypothetical protein